MRRFLARTRKRPFAILPSARRLGFVSWACLCRSRAQRCPRSSRLRWVVPWAAISAAHPPFSAARGRSTVSSKTATSCSMPFATSTRNCIHRLSSCSTRTSCCIAIGPCSCSLECANGTSRGRSTSSRPRTPLRNTRSRPSWSWVCPGLARVGITEVGLQEAGERRHGQNGPVSS